MAKDPACGMNVHEESAKHLLEYHGSHYYFCSKLCKESFEKDPEKYLCAS
jgi:YHS domain-containing protein